MNAPFKNILNFVSRCENSNCTCPQEILSHGRIFFSMLTIWHAQPTEVVNF